ncbi:Uncharacterised protein (plasmid) [Tsukamurella tyrosinosolvens]|uniref:Uncharacterized protein n=1 Tax=Tsukamurella tyrosinosolvens TaxID=57704 RepID=A0A1H4WTM3_TSUTY|nr:hypothetical protein [Tsukamurella tyrosinosolvens]KXO99713.1 hypothetical protein AXK58_00350 [Tsukamurella tyrosinosolvens]SEC96390.1 hypothetical protein SAMN04489793_3660 [Tsukamurella tyrosinosolvens]VEH89541.1 Uncharacterised protein [Tsukamurella tyrosinosolvens]
MSSKKYANLDRFVPREHGKSWVMRVGVPVAGLLVAIIVGTFAFVGPRASEYEDRSKECSTRLSTVDQKIRAISRIKIDDPARAEKTTTANDEFEVADNEARSACPMTEKEYITILDYTTYKVSAERAKQCARALPTGGPHCTEEDFDQALGTVSACAQSMSIDASVVKDWSTMKRLGQVIARWANSDSQIDSESYTPTTIPDPCGIKDRSAPWPPPRYS